MQQQVRGIPNAQMQAVVIAHRSGNQIHPRTSSSNNTQYYVCDEMDPPLPKNPAHNVVVWMQIRETAGQLKTLTLQQRIVLGVLRLIADGHRRIAIHCDAEDVLSLSTALTDLQLSVALASNWASGPILHLS